MPIRVAFVEDDAPFAEALSHFLGLSESIELIAHFPSAEEALQHIPSLRPELLLADINLPNMSGIELVARLKSQLPDLLCLMLTMYEETSLIFDALKAGACGYLLKR
ncbi:MAG: hypothetical protein RLZZ244_2933, partial [Verrucomicrobiota bacterium]